MLFSKGIKASAKEEGKPISGKERKGVERNKRGDGKMLKPPIHIVFTHMAPRKTTNQGNKPCVPCIYGLTKCTSLAFLFYSSLAARFVCMRFSPGDGGNERRVKHIELSDENVVCVVVGSRPV